MKTLTEILAKRAAGLLLALALVCQPLPALASSAPESTSAQGSSATAESGSEPASTGGGDASAPEESLPAASPGEGIYAPSFPVRAEGAVLINEETGLALYEKNADTPLVAASLVKLMTCILLVEHAQNLDTETVTAEQWVFDQLYGKNASHADIRTGETLTIRELLYAMLLPSANEAALMAAGYVSSGNLNNFLFQMNARAEALGCTGTTFTDPNGLSEQNMVTARDAALIMRAFLSYPELVEIAGTPSYEMAAHEKHGEPYFITSTNRLLATTSPYYSAFKGSAGSVFAGKTGSLGEWQNFASAAEKDGQRYICVVLHSPDAADELGKELEPPQARPALYESAALYDWAFTGYAVRPALDTTQPITEVRVKYTTDVDAVRLAPTQDLRTVLPIEADDSVIEKKFDLPEYLEAPIKQGDEIGSVTLSLGGQVIGTSKLVATQDVSRNSTLFVISKVGDFFSSVYLRVAIVVVIVAAGIYAAIVFYLAQKRQKQRRQKAAKHPPKR